MKEMWLSGYTLTEVTMRRFDDFNPGLLFIYYMAAIVPFMVIMDPLLSAAALLTGLIRVGIYER